MKLLLLLSLLFNAVLVGLLVQRPVTPATPPRVVRGESGTSAATRAGIARIHQFVPAAGESATRWAAIESRDWGQFAANLRAVGCPEETIRDLVITRIGRVYRDRLLVLDAEQELGRGFRQARNWREYQEDRLARQRLLHEMQSRAEALLGKPWNRLVAEVIGWPWSDPDHEYLPLDKRRQLRELELHYEQQRIVPDWRRSVTGLDDEDRAHLKELERQFESALVAMLTPAEYTEWKYRESPASRYARERLPTTARSEAEFRRIVDLVREYDLADHARALQFRFAALLPRRDPEWDDYLRRRAAFDEQLLQVLGEDRLVEPRSEERAGGD